jgi:hypothetical protein
MPGNIGELSGKSGIWKCPLPDVARAETAKLLMVAPVDAQ